MLNEAPNDHGYFPGPEIILIAPALIAVGFVACYFYRSYRCNQVIKRLRARGAGIQGEEINLSPQVQHQVARLRKILSRQSGVPESNIFLDDNFLDDLPFSYQGSDALAHLFVYIEKEFDITIPDIVEREALTMRYFIDHFIEPDSVNAFDETV